MTGMVTDQPQQCATCGLEHGEITCAPSRAARFAVPFGSVFFVLAFAFERWVVGVSAVAAIVLALGLGVLLGVAAWRTLGRYKLLLNGETCRVTSTRGTGAFRWDQVTGTGAQKSLIGRAHYVLVDGG